MNKYYILYSKPSCTIISESFVQNRIDAQFYSSEYLTIEKIEFDNGLDYVELGEIGTNFSYGTPPYGHICDKGVPYLRIPDIEDDFFLSDSNIAFIDKEYHLKNIRNEVKAGDVLFRIKGQLGQALVVPQKLSNSHTGSSFLRFTPKSINPYFLVCYLNSSFGRNQINRKQSNSIIQYLNIDDITSIRVPIPSPEIQKYIGDKVRKAEELREEAKRLKKEAEEILNNELNVKELLIKIDRYTEKHSWIMNSDINDRMDALYYNPQKITIKKFYKNYNLQKLKDLVDYKKGYAFKSEDYCNNTSTFLLRVSDISNNEVDMCNMLNLPDEFYQEYKDFNLINGDIVMAVTGTTGKSIVINNNKFKLLLNQNAIRMRIKEGIDISPYYIELILQSQYFQTLLKYSLYQSVQPFISMEFLNDVVIPIIDKTKIENISNLYEKSLNNLFYAKQLIQEAKQDVEDLIEGNFDMSKVKANS